MVGVHSSEPAFGTNVLLFCIDTDAKLITNCLVKSTSTVLIATTRPYPTVLGHIHQCSGISTSARPYPPVLDHIHRCSTISTSARLYPTVLDHICILHSFYKHFQRIQDSRHDNAIETDEVRKSLM